MLLSVNKLVKYRNVYMCKYCGKAEERLLVACDHSSTEKPYNLNKADSYMDKSWFLHRTIHNKQQAYEQPKDQKLPLFEHIFYTVSTAPIIIRTR